MAGLLLEDLPSRGKLAPSSPKVTFTKIPTSYICDHDTDPPEGQVVQHDLTNVIVRALQLKKDGGSDLINGGKGKRPAEPSSTALGKRRASESTHASHGAGSSGTARGGKAAISFTRAALNNKSTKELMEVLKDLGLSTKGKKVELITRILQNKRRRA